MTCAAISAGPSATCLPFDEGDAAQYEVIHGGVRFLALDTVIENSVQGRLCPPRLAWVEKKLAEPFAGQTTILMHHPPNDSGLAFFDHIGLVEGGEEFGRMIASHRGRLNVMCGHIHRPTQAMWNGAFVAVAGSPAFQTDLDLRLPAVDPTVVDIPYAYFIYNVGEAGLLSVHPRYVTLPARKRRRAIGEQRGLHDRQRRGLTRCGGSRARVTCVVLPAEVGALGAIVSSRTRQALARAFAGRDRLLGAACAADQ